MLDNSTFSFKIVQFLKFRFFLVVNSSEQLEHSKSTTRVSKNARNLYNACCIYNAISYMQVIRSLFTIEQIIYDWFLMVFVRLSVTFFR